MLITTRAVPASHLGGAVPFDEVRVHHPRYHQAKDGLRAVYGVATSQRDACLPADVHTTIKDLLWMQHSMRHSIRNTVAAQARPWRPGATLLGTEHTNMCCSTWPTSAGVHPPSTAIQAAAGLDISGLYIIRSSSVLLVAAQSLL